MAVVVVVVLFYGRGVGLQLPAFTLVGEAHPSRVNNVAALLSPIVKILCQRSENTVGEAIAVKMIVDDDAVLSSIAMRGSDCRISLYCCEAK